ncbi:MAG: hypothetical protein IID13_02075 [Candidatus Marinimicrobia bacterium]|nr:hypothetical protein [Candidatus Neomarinimicrobiota bacterium]
MDANERFEYMADKFYKDTGMMAPGKDSPAAFGVTDQKERMAAWSEWCEKFYSELFDSKPKYISVVDELPPLKEILDKPLSVSGEDIPPLNISIKVLRIIRGEVSVGAVEWFDHGWVNATHWQPLPQAPAKQSPQARGKKRIECKNKNCSATNGEGHSSGCKAEHEACHSDTLDTAGNRNPEFRYAGYKGHPLMANANNDQIKAYEEGVKARL